MAEPKRLIYEEDALANLQNDRFIIGQIGMIHSKSAIRSAPTVDPLEALGIGRREDCEHAYELLCPPCYGADYVCSTWHFGCKAHEFCSRFERRKHD